MTFGLSGYVQCLSRVRISVLNREPALAVLCPASGDDTWCSILWPSPTVVLTHLSPVLVMAGLFGLWQQMGNSCMYSEVLGHYQNHLACITLTHHCVYCPNWVVRHSLINKILELKFALPGASLQVLGYVQ
jgi:hypothetical protein